MAALLLANVAQASTADILSTGMIRSMVAETAVAYNIDPVVFMAVAECESGFDTDVQSNYYHKGVREDSYGLFQIRLSAHKDVSYENATSALFSLNWAAQNWSKASELWVSCYKKATKDIPVIVRH